MWGLYRIHEIHSWGKLETGTSEDKEEVGKKKRWWLVGIYYNLKIKCAICCHELMAFLVSGSLVQWSVNGNMNPT